MKQLLTLAILVLFPSIGWTEIYLYPEKVEQDVDPNLPPMSGWFWPKADCHTGDFLEP